MKLFFSGKAIDKLKQLNAFQNIGLTTTQVITQADPGVNGLAIIANEKDFSKYEEKLETHAGIVYADTHATRLLGHDNKIDYDTFRQVFILIVDGHIADDNLYLDTQ